MENSVVPKMKDIPRELKNDPTVLAMQGCRLAGAAVEKLEGKLKRNPSDLTSRLKLLGHYFMARKSSKRAARKQQEMIVWLITNLPELKILSSPPGRVYAVQDRLGYNKCKRLWLKQLAVHQDDVAVITNAAQFLSSDIGLSEKLFRQAIALEPDSPEWSRDLAWMLRRGARKNSARMKRALIAIQEAMRKSAKTVNRWYMLDDMAEIAFELDEWKLAELAAKESISLAGNFQDNWYYGNAIHKGNCVLGRLALKRGQTKKAIFYLAAASKTTGSPQLNSFGPNMLFAQEMLRAGHREPVIRYLKECKRYWEGRTAELCACIEKIEAGKSPRLPRVIR